MINYPKRTIADRVANSHKQPKKNNMPISKERHKQDLVETDDYKAPSKWADILYPSKLWRLYNNINNLHALPEKKRRQILEGMPPTLSAAETLANKMLYKFISAKVREIGSRQYYKLVEQAMTINSTLMMAYRCVIACMSDYKPDELDIYRNEVMNSIDFFSKDSIKTYIDPVTGREEILIDNSSEPYDRSDSFISSKHRRIYHIKADNAANKEDYMPEYFAERMKDIVRRHGGKVPDTLKQAWDELEHISNSSSVEERILARIAYLIGHSMLNSNRSQIGYSDG